MAPPVGDVPGWMADALCAQVGDPDQFFPDEGGNPWTAKAICHRCDVRAECLQYALDHDEPHGVWGGLTPRGRQRLRSPRARTEDGFPAYDEPSVLRRIAGDRVPLDSGSRLEVVRRMHAQGCHDREIARRTGIDKRQVYRDRERLWLAPANPRPRTGDAGPGAGLRERQAIRRGMA